MRRLPAFSLIEVTLALGVIGFCLLAIFALIPVGLNSARDAIDSTHLSLIVADVQTRVRSSVTDATFASSNDLTLPALYYDQDGTALPNYTGAVYRVIATVAGDWSANPSPANVNADFLRPVTIQVGWPVDNSTGNLVGNNAARSVFSYYLSKP